VQVVGPSVSRWLYYLNTADAERRLGLDFELLRRPPFQNPSGTHPSVGKVGWDYRDCNHQELEGDDRRGRTSAWAVD